MKEKTQMLKTNGLKKKILQAEKEFRIKSSKVLAKEENGILYYTATMASSLCTRAKSAAKNISFYKEIPAIDDKISIAEKIASDFLEVMDEMSEKKLCIFFESRKRKYDSITLAVFQPVLFAQIFFRIKNAFDERKTEETSFLIRCADRMKFIDFSRIFLSFSITNELLTAEKADIYRYCDRKTKFEYISEIVSLSQKEKKSEKQKVKELLLEADRKNIHIGEVIMRKNPLVVRIYCICLAFMTIVASLLYFVLCGFDISCFVVFPAVILSVYNLVKQILALCFKNAGNDGLPRLCGEKVRHEKAVIAIMSILNGAKDDGELFERLENFYLSDENPNRFYALVCNLPDAERKNEPFDKEILAFAKGRISALNAKYGDHFGIFIRERRYSRSERKYIGWERKRGAVLELCRFMRDEKTSITDFIGDKKFLSESKYLITLDSDTNLYAGAADELVGTMLHPMNTPKVESGAVISGHAVVQPHIATELKSAAGTDFSSIICGNGGIDSYAHATFDIYENVFGNGSFCGKGILDVDTFLKVCDGFFPRERILSHDILEGNLLGSAIAGDITLTDSSPQTALSYYTRHHRWLRGDLQTIPYLFKTVINTEGKRVKNPMNTLSKYKIAETLINAISPFMVVCSLIFVGFFAPQNAWITTAFLLSYLCFVIIQSVLYTILSKEKKTALRRFHSRAMPIMKGTFLYAFYKISALAYESWLFLDAAVRTGYRFLVSKQNFLNWKTASSADKEESNLKTYLDKMWFSLFIGAFSLLSMSWPLKILGILWLSFPVLMYTSSQKNTIDKRVFTKSKEKIYGYAKDMWGFFRDLVNEETNYLPPDNYEISPVDKIAYRTSPTNIGLYLTSLVGARDLGFIKSDELEFYARNTANTLSKLPKWKGNLYNWYDIKTLDVIGTPFISTVDSGNFVCAVSAFCEGIKDYASEYPKLLDILNFYEGMIKNTDLASLFDENAKLFYIGYDAARDSFSDSYYDIYMSEARMTSYFAVATSQIPREHFFATARPVVENGVYSGIASWSGTAFEYFMPALFLPTIPDSLSDEALHFAFKMEKKQAIKRFFLGKRYSFFGVSESGYWHFDSEMNYQYKAFGLSKLSLDPEGKNAQVISPYSSFLMLRCGVEECIENLESIKKIGGYGEYGFFESVDFERLRVGDGFGIVKSFMAHHLGMSFIASVNFLNNDIFVNRFIRRPKLRASQELLCEKIAVNATAIPLKVKDKRKPKPNAYFSDSLETNASKEIKKCDILLPESLMISNNKLRVIASSSGHISIYNGNNVVFRSDFDKFSLGQGLRCYIVSDDEILPLVPLGARSSYVSSNFEFYYKNGRLCYRAEHIKNNKKAVTELNIRLSASREMCEFSISVTGDISSAYAFIYGEPIISEEHAFLSHKSFSNLFLESRYESDEEILIFSRRSKIKGTSENYLAIKAFPEISGGEFDTKRDDILPLLYGEEEIAKTSKKVLSGSNGAMIIPALAMKTGSRSEKKKFYFRIALADTEDDVKYLLANQEKFFSEKEFSRIERLQIGTSGIKIKDMQTERSLLNYFLFGSLLNKNAVRISGSRDVFWKRGISSENNIVILRFKEYDRLEFSRLLSYLCVFKYMCIKGFRFDLLILYKEKDLYNMSIGKSIESCIVQVGCGNFLRCENGIFPLQEQDFTEKELLLLERASDVAISLSKPCETYYHYGQHENELLSKSENWILKVPERKICALEFSLPEELIAQNLTGYFRKNGYVIKKPNHAIPFSYIMANEKFGTILSENSLGFSYFENSYLGKLTPHSADNMMEDAGERILLRVYKSNDDSYEDFDLAICAEEVSFFDGKAEYRGIAASLKYRLCVELFPIDPIKKYHVEFENPKEKKVKIIFAAKPCLSDKKLRANEYVFEENKGVLIVSSIFEKRFFVGVGASPRKMSFCFDNAALISDGQIFSGVEDVASLSYVCNDQNVECSFYLSALTDEFTIDDFSKTMASDTDFSVDNSMFEKIKIETSEPVFDLSVNYLFPYQTLKSRLYARAGFYQVGGAYGYRDQLQDTLSFIETAPDLCREQIKKCAAHQYVEGDVTHWWHSFLGKETGLRSRYSDDLLWLPYALAEYVEKTGDEALLYEKEPYLDSPPLNEREKDRYEELVFAGNGTVYEHAEKAIKLALNRGVGIHGLLKIGGGDWNDGMNAVGKDGKGESVWLTEFCAIICFKFSNIARKIKGEEERFFLEFSEKLFRAVKNSFVDGWYLRGYYDNGAPLGKSGNRECEIDSLSQSFAAFMEFTMNGEVSESTKSALEKAFSHLYDEKTGVMKLLSPPFNEGAERPGYIKGYLPGIRENGGQYTHAAVWMAMALLYSGKINEGILVLKSINPALMSLEQSFSERYLIEPYALAGDVYSHPECMGRGGWSFYTGSAAWYKKAVLECVFGFIQKDAGFYLHPHMNKDFDGATLTIDTHETSYTIKYLFSDKEGIVLDGKIVETASERMREFFFEFDKNKHHVDYCIKLRED